MIRNDALAAAQAQLRPGERLLWSGRPRAGALALSRARGALSGAATFVFAVVWIAIAYSITSMGGMGNEGSPWSYFWMFGLVFAAIGLWSMLGVPLALLEAPAMVYGVTDQRVFIASSFPLRAVQSWGPADINHLEISERADRSGNLLFRRDESVSGRHRTRTVTYQGFRGIPEVRQVEALVARLSQPRRGI